MAVNQTIGLRSKQTWRIILMHEKMYFPSSTAQLPQIVWCHNISHNTLCEWVHLFRGIHFTQGQCYYDIMTSWLWHYDVIICECVVTFLHVFVHNCPCVVWMCVCVPGTAVQFNLWGGGAPWASTWHPLLGWHHHPGSWAPEGPLIPWQELLAPGWLSGPWVPPGALKGVFGVISHLALIKYYII